MTKLTRMERVLIHIIDGLRENIITGPYSRGARQIRDSAGHHRDDQVGHYVHFASWYTWFEEGKKLEPGMLVFCSTSGIHPHTVAEIVEVYDQSRCLLRSLNDDSLCDVGNEAFVPIIGLTAKDLETDAQVEFRRKVRKAIKQLDHYFHLFGGLEFSGDAATIRIRKRHGGMGLQNRETVPYEVRMPWNSRTTIKAIRETLREHGYGQREFEIRLDLRTIGSDYNVVAASVSFTAGQRWDIESFLYYETLDGHRFNLVTSLTLQDAHAIASTLNGMKGCRIDVETKNGERFVVMAYEVADISVKRIRGYWVEFVARDVSFRLADDTNEKGDDDDNKKDDE